MKIDSRVLTTHHAMLTLSTPYFENDGWFPDKYTGQGENLSPEFHIEGIAEKAETTIIALDDPEHPVRP